jgi:hypothetical protein
VRFRIAAANFVADDGETLTQGGGKIDSRWIH